MVNNSNSSKTTSTKERFSFIFLMFRKESRFLIFIGVCFLLAGVFYPYAHIAMWIGFILAAYSAVSNDSIQTIGTFIASNSDKKWWVLWLFIGSIFFVTVLYSWINYNGDVSHQRLLSKGFAEQPSSFHFLQVAAPIFLLIITRLKMPVSTTFLLLSSLSTTEGAIFKVMQKSMTGYFIAFFVAITVWVLLNPYMKRWFKGEAAKIWTVFQWITSGSLWSLWIVQDAANIAVFLPRSLSLTEFIIFSLTIFLGLGLLFFLKGDRIQHIVNEKSHVTDVRPATIIDLIYALILIYFTWVNTVPMSTTWVFIGLLGGRELGIKISEKESLKETWRIIIKDAAFALTGLLVSIIIAASANPRLGNEILALLGF